MLKSREIDQRLEAGCDEVGRGCLAGPVVAAAVILPPNFTHIHLNDSKTVSATHRQELSHIIQKNAIAWAVSFIEPVIIDRINILNASFLAMERAVKRLNVAPEHLLIDGNRFKTSLDIPYTCIIKGDSKNGSIAAASILAKTYRDEYMQRIHGLAPAYGWNSNVGYPTTKHRKGILKIGPSPYHRKSFRLLNEQLILPFAD